MATSTVAVRFDPGELSRIDAAAQRAGITRSTYIREAVRGSLAPGELDVVSAAVCEHGLRRCFVCGPVDRFSPIS